MATKNAINSNLPIELSNGGTNATSFATNLGIIKYDGTRLVTSAASIIDASNIHTNTSQPCFSAYSSSVADVTGDSTVYTMIFGNEIFDIGANYDTITGTFTAPVTGRYFLYTSIDASGILNTHVSNTGYINTSNRNYFSMTINPYNFSSSGRESNNFGCFADMDTGDVANVVYSVSGGTKVIDITDGAATMETKFEGVLLC